MTHVFVWSLGRASERMYNHVSMFIHIYRREHTPSTKLTQAQLILLTELIRIRLGLIHSLLNKEIYDPFIQQEKRGESKALCVLMMIMSIKVRLACDLV